MYAHLRVGAPGATAAAHEDRAEDDFRSNGAATGTATMHCIWHVPEFAHSVAHICVSIICTRICMDLYTCNTTYNAVLQRERLFADIVTHFAYPTRSELYSRQFEGED